MRLIHYCVFNKETKKAVYVNCREDKCREHLASLENQDKYEIRYKWVSI